MPPILLVHGTVDSKVPFRNALRLQSALQEANITREVIAIKDGDHGMASWDTLDQTYKQKMVTWRGKNLHVRE